MSFWDVIVVGAGPVGAYLSRCLTERGYRVLLLDKKGKTGRRICAGVIGAEAFQRFPLPMETVLSSVRSITMVSPSGKRLRHTSRAPMAHVVDRVAFDRTILKEAVGRGVEFYNLSKVVGVERDPSGIKVVCRNGRDNEGVQHFKGAMAVFATGYNPGLLDALGLPGYPGAVVGIQSEALMEGVEEIEVYLGQRVAPGGFAWLVPMGDGRVRMGLVAQRDAKDWLFRFISSPVVSSRLVDEPGPIRAAWIPMGPISRTFGDRFLVVGEAAGQVKTTTYGGIYYGLLCAEKALNTIDKAFEKGDWGEGLLSFYHRAWWRLLGDEMEAGAHLRDMVVAMEDTDLDDLFVLLGSDGILPRLRATVRFDWHRESIRLLIGRVLKYAFETQGRVALRE